MYIDEFKFDINKLLLPAQTCMRIHICKKERKREREMKKQKDFNNECPIICMN